MHQQPGQKAVVHIFCCGDFAEGRHMSVQHFRTQQSIILVFHGGNQVLHIFHLFNGIYRGSGDKIFQGIVVRALGKAYSPNVHLKAAFKFRYFSPDFNHLAFFRRAELPVEIPHFSLHFPGRIGNGRIEIGFPVGGGANRSGFQDIESFDNLSRSHVGKLFVIFHAVLLFFHFR